jgi:hypothetical protein
MKVPFVGDKPPVQLSATRDEGVLDGQG